MKKRVWVSSSPMMVEVEVSQLQQVLANLILNAIQASQSASEVKVGLSRQRARKPGEPDSPVTACIVLTGADSGEGIIGSFRGEP